MDVLEKDDFLSLPKRLNIVVGAYGSGKTEICVNMAVRLANLKNRVNLADLDIANPYFRSREVQDFLREQGVNPVVPSGEEQFSDLPVILPQIKGMLKAADEDYSLFDVGGDETGARVLASLHEGIASDEYNLMQVINSKRPFTSTVSGCIDMKNRVEQTSCLKVDSYIINSHLMEFTDEIQILEAFEFAKELEQAGGVKISYFSVMEGVMNLDKLRIQIDYPILLLKRRMLPPWLKINGSTSWPVTGNRL